MTDTLRQIYCPACKTEMKKIFIPKDGVVIDICTDGCGGMFFNNREFKLFDEQDENIDEIVEAIKGKVFKKVDETNKRACPNCGADMVKNYSSINKTIQVDDCYACGGKFLDDGEIFKIREEYVTEGDRSAAVIDFLNTSPEGILAQETIRNAQIAHANRSFFKKLFDKAAGIE